DQPNKEELFISDHPKTKLQIVVTDYRPKVEIIFSKRSLDAMQLSLEDFIAVKGIKALGNQLTDNKVKLVNRLEPLPHTPVEEVEVLEDTVEDGENDQTTLF
ncbi:MAG: DNA gyrase/topoisomerase IV subunit A, partial [Wenyingzhuangia sp.]